MQRASPERPVYHGGGHGQASCHGGGPSGGHGKKTHDVSKRAFPGAASWPPCGARNLPTRMVPAKLSPGQNPGVATDQEAEAVVEEAM
jgi:hypothetical protein